MGSEIADFDKCLEMFGSVLKLVQDIGCSYYGRLI